ncbi:cytochrome P450 [Coniochaeta sp. 2T2.1]|nr:cytochrome P450 [Coniochaeta sp. 2T2.1]
MSTTLIVTTLGLLLVTRFIVKALHRLFFHSLHSIPGPWINRVSELPAAWALVRGDQHLYYRFLHDKYGPVVRVSPSEVSFISVEAREEIYGFRKSGPLMEKSPIFLGAVGNVNGQTGVSLALNADHARQRSALGYLFTNSALLQFEHLFQLQIQKFIAVLEEAASQNRPIDVSSWYTYLAFDIMGDICFAVDTGYPAAVRRRYVARVAADMAFRSGKRCGLAQDAS